MAFKNLFYLKIQNFNIFNVCKTIQSKFKGNIQNRPLLTGFVVQDHI